jgi:predicted nucleotidyltransferase
MDVESLIAALEGACRSGPPLRLAVLFGSFAVGRPRSGSDVDVAIVPEDEGLALSDELALQVQLARACGREVDLVRLDLASTLVRWQVARHGRLIAEGRRGEFHRFRASAASDYIDFAPALERAGERFRRRLVEDASSER